ncbi:MAG: winged helix-turn-helix domain-containing protein [Nitrospirota bacterium]
MTTQILLFSENTKMMKTLGSRLGKEGFALEAVTGVEDLLAKTKKRLYDLIVLNLISLGTRGLDLCRTLKHDPRTAGIPIIIISETGNEIDAVLSLEIGADDYMTEPLKIKELAARMKAVLRRANRKPQETALLERGDLVIDREKCIVMRKGKRIELTAQAYKLVCFLAENPGKVFNREQLYQSVWNQNGSVGLRTIDVHIRKLRQKLEEDPDNPRYIKTLRGIGYFFEESLPPADNAHNG